MTSNMKLQFYLILIVFLIGSAVRAQVPVGRSLNYNSNVPRTEDGVPILDRPYENSRLASQSTRRNPPTHDDQGLNLYEDFVNDPWKPTEDLGTLLSQRAGGRPQVRSGGRYDSADDIWSRNRQPYQRPSPVATPVAAQSRPFTPVYGNEGNGYWAVQSRGDNHITYVRRDQYAANPTTTPLPTVDARGVETNWRSGAAASRSATNLRSNSDPPHGVNGDEDWIVESRSDGHITYRKRTRSGQNAAGVHGWRNPSGNTGIRTLGHGDGKVLARVVNTETDDAFASVHSGYNRGARTDAGTRAGLASYKSMKSNYAHENRGEESGKSHLQLKSGDYVSYRRRDGNEAVYNRYRQPSTTATPVQFEQEGDWRVVSKGDSHITWSRVGSEYGQSPRPSVSHRTGRYYGSGPQYPMMRERAFQERDSRVGGSQNVLVV